MNGTRLGRGSKGRTLALCGVVALLVLLVYVFRQAHVQLGEARSSADKCFQQQESLSAQFQVILEYKTRLEKSLQAEKGQAAKLREELQKEVMQEKDAREKDKAEAAAKFESLQQQFKILQSQRDDLQQDFDRLRESELKAVEDKSRLESRLDSLQEQEHGLEQELQACKERSMQAESEKAQQLQRYSRLQHDFKQAGENNKFFLEENTNLKQQVEQLHMELRHCQQRPTPGAAAPVLIAGNLKPSTEAAPQQQAPREQLTSSSSTHPSAQSQGHAFQHQLVAPALQVAPAQPPQSDVLDLPHKKDHQESRMQAVIPIPARLNKKHVASILAKPQQYNVGYGLQNQVAQLNSHDMYQYHPEVVQARGWQAQRQDGWEADRQRRQVVAPYQQQLARPYKQGIDYNMAAAANGGANYFVPVDANHNGFHHGLSQRVHRRDIDAPVLKPPQPQMWHQARKDSHETNLLRHARPDYAYDQKKEEEEENKDKEEEIPRVPQEGIPLDGDEDEDDLDPLEYEMKGGEDHAKVDNANNPVQIYPKVGHIHPGNEKMDPN